LKLRKKFAVTKGITLQALQLLVPERLKVTTLPKQMGMKLRPVRLSHNHVLQVSGLIIWQVGVTTVGLAILLTMLVTVLEAAHKSLVFAM
jgi:hypothetical protein